VTNWYVNAWVNPVTAVVLVICGIGLIVLAIASPTLGLLAWAVVVAATPPDHRSPLER
jgi:hypothetical protein